MPGCGARRFRAHGRPHGNNPSAHFDVAYSPQGGRRRLPSPDKVGTARSSVSDKGKTKSEGEMGRGVLSVSDPSGRPHCLASVIGSVRRKVNEFGGWKIANPSIRRWPDDSMTRSMAVKLQWGFVQGAGSASAGPRKVSESQHAHSGWLSQPIDLRGSLRSLRAVLVHRLATREEESRRRVWCPCCPSWRRFPLSS